MAPCALDPVVLCLSVSSTAFLNLTSLCVEAAFITEASDYQSVTWQYMVETKSTLSAPAK